MGYLCINNWQNCDSAPLEYKSIVSLFAFIWFRDYHQAHHRLYVSCTVVKILRLAKCWRWWKLNQEVDRVSKYFLSIFWSIHWPLIRYIDRTLKTGSRYISHTGTRPYPEMSYTKCWIYWLRWWLGAVDRNSLPTPTLTNIFDAIHRD